jgi:hypothetical protein
MSERFAAIHRWLSLNGLALNPDKSAAIVVGTGARRQQGGEIRPAQLGNVIIPVSGSVRSPGVTFHRTLFFDLKFNHTCKISICHFRTLRCILSLMTTDDAKQVATAVVSPKLDNCNSLLFGTSMFIYIGRKFGNSARSEPLYMHLLSLV